MATKYYERDLHLEARQRTRRGRYKGMRNLLADSLFILKTISLPGKPVSQSFQMSAIAKRADVVWFPDLNKYRVRDLRLFVDAGCKAIMLRMGGPTRWVEGNWGYAIDPTYRPYLEQADKLGMLGQTIGYIVHNAYEPWTVNGATGETIHTELIDEWTSGGYMPAAFSYDHEIDTYWTSFGAERKITEPNLVTSLAENTNNTYKKYRRAVSVYSAKWFMNLNADRWLRHDTWFNNMNKPEAEGGAGVQRPLHLAWYGQNMTATYTNMQEISDALFVPTPEQVGKYLYTGYQANAWQFSPTVKLGGDAIGVDMNVSLDPAKVFYYNFGLVEPGVTPPPPPPPPPTDLSQVIARLGVVEAGQAKLETWAGQFPGAYVK